MAKQEPDNEAEAVTNNARHGNEIHKPYYKGSVVTTARKLFKLSLQGQAMEKQTRILLQAVNLMP